MLLLWRHFEDFSTRTTRVTVGDEDFWPMEFWMAGQRRILPKGRRTTEPPSLLDDGGLVVLYGVVVVVEKYPSS